MDLNITELAVSQGESINLLNTVVGLAGGVIGVLGAFFGAYIWFVDRRNMRKATLYLPLFLACREIVDVINNYESLGEERSKHLFASSAKTLDEIVYDQGSIIHLKKAKDIRTFLSMKRAIDEKLESIEQHNWIALKDMFKSNEFKEIESRAKALLLRCGKEVKSLRKL